MKRDLQPRPLLFKIYKVENSHRIPFKDILAFRIQDVVGKLRESIPCSQIDSISTDYRFSNSLYVTIYYGDQCSLYVIVS